MGMGISITTSNADTLAFTNWMDAAWYDPTTRGDHILSSVNGAVTLDLIQTPFFL